MKKASYYKRFAGVIATVFAIMAISGFNRQAAPLNIIGVWESEEKDLQIEIFDEGDEMAGRMIYFKCASDEVMRNSKDVNNPDETLVDRNLLGLKLVTQLSYKGDGLWDDGKIYDPNSGYTYDARIQLTDANTATVRGYWKFKWLGRSMVFNRR
jgi:uncharacterized protein (DUF2147 family)